MAKQNVGFGERHVEKFVAGAVGAIFLGVVFLYGVQDPYTVEAAGEAVGPSEFYRMIAEETDQVVQTLRNARSPEFKPWTPPEGSRQRTAPATELVMIPVPVNPPVPSIEADIQVGDRKLVAILPPSRPVVTTGRAYAVLPPTQVKTFELDASQLPNPTVEPLPKDVQWASVFTVIDRKAQQEIFHKALYITSRHQLVVTGVEIERQKLLPDGRWSDKPEVLRPYAPVVFEPRRTLGLVQQDDGTMAMSEADYAYINMVTQDTNKREAQSDILRPSFQNLLPPEAQLEWKVPESLPGREKIDWQQDFQVAVAEKKDEKREVAGGAAPPPNPRQEIRKNLTDAKVAADKGDFLEAERLLQAVDTNSEALPAEKTEAQTLLRNLMGKILAARRQEENKARGLDSTVLGPDKDIMWANDVTAEPGATYRYRVRLLTLNQHAGIIRLLADPKDAAKLILPSEWSEWSDPVMIPENNYFFFTSADPKSGTAKVQINRWTRGGWAPAGRQDVAIGQPIAWTERYVDYKYDAIVANLAVGVPYEERRPNTRTGAIEYQAPKETSVLTLISSDGSVEERVASVDLRDWRDVKRIIDEEEKRKKELEGTTPQPMPTRRQDLQDPTRGRGPAFELDRHRGRGGRPEDW